MVPSTDYSSRELRVPMTMTIGSDTEHKPSKGAGSSDCQNQKLDMSTTSPTRVRQTARTPHPIWQRGTAICSFFKTNCEIL